MGFAIIAAIIATGLVAARAGVVGRDAPQQLNRLAFFVLTPLLLFTVLAESDVGSLFSALLPISAIAAGLVMLGYAFVSMLLWRRPAADTVIGSLGAGLVNANNIGLPISAYVLGDAASSTPVMLLQFIVITPIALAILDATAGRRPPVLRMLLQPLRNPLIVASALGLVVAVSGITLPDIVTAPLEMIGAAAIPIVLLAYGMSLHGARVLSPGAGRRDIVVASALKLVAMPAIAWVFAQLVFGLDGHALFTVVVLAGLPTAQNVFTFAQRYGTATVVARDIVLVTTLVSAPVLMLLAAALS